MYFKKYRSKIDRIWNFYNYCLTLNNDSFYSKLLANDIQHYQKMKATTKKEKSKSTTGVTYTNKIENGIHEQFPYTFDSLAVFKFFYLKYFICYEDFCEINPINYLMPDIIENGLDYKYNVDFEFYDKNFGLVNEIKGTSINKDNFLKILIYEENENNFNYFIEIDDSNNKIDRTLIDEVKQIVDKSWNKFHNSDKIAFFEKHKTYFKESIDEFKNIRCK